MFSSVEQAYLNLLTTIAGYQTLFLCVDEQQKAHVRELISGLTPPVIENIQTLVIDHDDSWARDFGPITTLANNQLICLDFTFNGWGGKYPGAQDNSVNRVLAKQKYLPSFQSVDVVLEGGAIDCNGSGTLITTSRCLIDSARNPGLGKKDYEDLFASHFGTSTTLWLNSGWLAGDDTDGHVDMLARFCASNTLVYTRCNEPEDIHYTPLQRMQRELRAFRNSEGDSFELVALPLPRAIYSGEGDRLAASYANFLILNDAVICPVYNCEQDALALNTLSRLFPDRTIEAVDARAFIHQGGSIHCLSMQIPSAPQVS